MVGIEKDWTGVRVLGKGERKLEEAEVSRSLFFEAERCSAAIPAPAAEEAIGKTERENL